jgi:cysteine desulfurase
MVQIPNMAEAPVYLDCNATTPVDPRVRAAVLPYLDEEFGNSGSRTHEYGSRAKVAVQRARDRVGALVNAQRDEVIFTSGATESNNLAILGLRAHGETTGHRHIITSAAEHKAVLEPCQELERLGFSVTYLAPNKSGFVPPDQLANALRPDTGLVTLMHVNNETGAVQPIGEYARVLAGHSAYFHVDAAQGFGKLPEDLRLSRIDLISISGHKIYGPKGIGALVGRRRGYEKTPLQPLMFGGGQERGLRPGTLPVPLIVGLGVAAELAQREHKAREKSCAAVRRMAVKALTAVGGVPTVPDQVSIASTLSISFPDIDSEGLMVATKELVAISNGAACTSSSYNESHVLAAMGLSRDVIRGTVRISWCHLTPEVDWPALAAIIHRLH